MASEVPMEKILVTGKELKRLQDKAEMHFHYKKALTEMTNYAIDLQDNLKAIRKVWLENAKRWQKHGVDPELGDAIVEIGRPLIGVDTWNLEKMVKVMESSEAEGSRTLGDKPQ